ncbi:MAG: peptide ABC transporter substrate-binding protein [Candidatus Dormibacteria bacterium]
MAIAAIAVGGATGAVSSRLTPPSVDYREALVVQHLPVSLNPLLGGREDPAVRDLGGLLYRSLLRLDERAVPVPDLSVAVGISGDGLSYRFTMPAGRRWSNGTPLTSADVVATVALVQSPQYPDAALAAAWQGVTVSTDPSSVTLTLPAPRAAFAVAVAGLPILPAQVIAGHPVSDLLAHQSRAMTSSGPFRLASAEPGLLRLVRNPYAPVPPRMQRIELRLVPTFAVGLKALSSGQVDGLATATAEQRAEVARLSGVTLHDALTFRFTDLLFNERTPGLDDPAVRHAISATVDRHQLVETALHGAGLAQQGAIPQGIVWARGAAQPEQPDVAAAGRALDAAGFTMGGDGVRRRGAVALSYRVSVPSAPPLPAVGRALARQLAPLGVMVSVKQVASDQFESSVIIPHAFQLAVADWAGDADPDVSSFWRSNAAPPQGLNVSGAPPDAFLDQALDSLATVTDLQLRAQAAARVNAQLAEDVPAVFLYAPTVGVGLRRAVAGAVVPATGGSAARWAALASWPGRDRGASGRPLGWATAPRWWNW